MTPCPSATEINQTISLDQVSADWSCTRLILVAKKEVGRGLRMSFPSSRVVGGTVSKSRPGNYSEYIIGGLFLPFKHARLGQDGKQSTCIAHIIILSRQHSPLCLSPPSRRCRSHRSHRIDRRSLACWLAYRDYRRTESRGRRERCASMAS